MLKYKLQKLISQKNVEHIENVAIKISRCQGLVYGWGLGV
jgi:hypothetical protein